MHLRTLESGGADVHLTLGGTREKGLMHRKKSNLGTCEEKAF